MSQLTRQVPADGIVAGLNDEVSTAIAAKRLVGYDAAAGPLGVLLATGATVVIVGVTNESIAAGKVGDVQRYGKAILTAGSGGVTIGAKITSDGAGKGIITTTNNHIVSGEAVTAAAEDEDFEINLTPGATLGA